MKTTKQPNGEIRLHLTDHTLYLSKEDFMELKNAFINQKTISNYD